MDTYKSLVVCNPHSDKSILFWRDNLNNVCLQQQWPHLFSFAANPNITAYDMIRTDDLTCHFHLTLSTAAYEQFIQLNEFIQNCTSSAENDEWTYIWSKKSFIPAKPMRPKLSTLTSLPAFIGFGHPAASSNTNFLLAASD